MREGQSDLPGSHIGQHSPLISYSALLQVGTQGTMFMMRRSSIANRWLNIHILGELVQRWSFCRYILKHIRYWGKKNRSVETTAANNGQKKKLALKSQERCRWTRQALMVQTQLKTKPRRTLLKLNSKGWSEPLAIYSCSIMQCKLCLPRETELAVYNISTSPFASM